MRKNEGSVRTLHFDTTALQRKISVDGNVLPIRKATAEEFDIYIYSILYQMYEKKGHAHKRYEMSFWEYDFGDPLYRLFALNELYKLNLARRGATPPKRKIPLFAEEEEQVNA